MSSHTGHHHRTSGGKLSGTILLNLAITVAEFLGGILSGYLALLADAVHNLSDVAALVLAWLGARGSERPATKRQTFGLKRLEVMTALVSAIALVVIAAFIFQEAYHRYLQPRPLERPWLFLTIAMIGLIGNGFSVWLLFSEKNKSLNMKTAFLHLIYDTISSVAVIVGGVIILWTGWMLLDVILSVLIGVMILWSSYRVIREALLIFLEAVPEGIDFDTVHKAITGVARVRDVHDLHIWSLSSKEVALSCHVCVDDSDYVRGPELIAEINRLLAEKFGIGHGTIQIETAGCARTDLLCRHNSHS